MRTKGFSSFLTPGQSCQQHTALARASLGSSCTVVHKNEQREITCGIQLIPTVPVNTGLWLALLLELRSHLPGSSSAFTTICITVVAENLISEPMAALGSCTATEIGLWDEIQLTKPRFLDLFQPQLGTCTGPMNCPKWARKSGRISSEGDVLPVYTQN